MSMMCRILAFEPLMALETLTAPRTLTVPRTLTAPRTLMAPRALMALLCLASGAAFAEDAPAGGDASNSVPAARAASALTEPRPRQLELDGTSIRGSQELPRVLYILPWQDPGAAELAGRPFNSLIEDVLSPLDRDVFRRELGYHQQFSTTRIDNTQSDSDGSSATEPGSGIEEVSRP